MRTSTQVIIDPVELEKLVLDYVKKQDKNIKFDEKRVCLSFMNGGGFQNQPWKTSWELTIYEANDNQMNRNRARPRR